MYRLIPYLIATLGLFILLFGLVSYLGALLPGIDSSAPEMVIQEQNEIIFAKLIMISGFCISLAGSVWIIIRRRKLTLTNHSSGTPNMNQ